MAQKRIQSPPVPRAAGTGIHRITEKSNSGEWDHRAETFKWLCLKAARPGLSQGEKKTTQSRAGACRATGRLSLGEGSSTLTQQLAGLALCNHAPTHGAEMPQQMQKHHTSEIAQVSWDPAGLTGTGLALDQDWLCLPH